VNGPDIVWVGLAGGLGAAVRFAVDGGLRRRIAGDTPVGTMVVNLSGSLLFGILTGLVLFHRAPGVLALVGGTGFCGGYTTFSTASFETVRLLQRGEHANALVTAAGTLFGCLATAAAGLGLAAL